MHLFKQSYIENPDHEPIFKNRLNLTELHEQAIESGMIEITNAYNRSQSEMDNNNNSLHQLHSTVKCNQKP